MRIAEKNALGPVTYEFFWSSQLCSGWFVRGGAGRITRHAGGIGWTVWQLTPLLIFVESYAQLSSQSMSKPNIYLIMPPSEILLLSSFQLGIFKARLSQSLRDWRSFNRIHPSHVQEKLNLPQNPHKIHPFLLKGPGFPTSISQSFPSEVPTCHRCRRCCGKHRKAGSESC